VSLLTARVSVDVSTTDLRDRRRGPLTFVIMTGLVVWSDDAELRRGAKCLTPRIGRTPTTCSPTRRRRGSLSTRSVSSASAATPGSRGPLPATCSMTT